MDNPTITILSFLFSPKGRMARLPFLAVVVVVYGAFIGLVNVWNSNSGVLRVVLNVVILALFAVKFIMTARRLHDIRLPAFLGAPNLILIAWAGYNNFAVSYLHAPAFSLPGYLLLGHQALGYNAVTLGILMAILVLTDLVLIFIPGTKGSNRYGGDGRTPTGAVADLF